MLVEAREQARQIVEVAAHHVRGAFTSNHVQRLFKLQQARRQLGFTIFSDHHVGVGQHALVNFRFTEYGEHAGVGILHVRRGIALKGQHVIPVEDVVGGAVFREIRILHRADTDRVSQLFQFVGRHIWVLLRHQTAGALQRLVQQIGELHGTAGAGFERLAVFTQHHAEHVVL